MEQLEAQHVALRVLRADGQHNPVLRAAGTSLNGYIFAYGEAGLTDPLAWGAVRVDALGKVTYLSPNEVGATMLDIIPLVSEEVPA